MKSSTFTPEQLTELDSLICARVEEIVAQRLGDALTLAARALGAAPSPASATISVAGPSRPAKRGSDSLPIEQQVMTARSLARAIGFRSPWAIYAIKKANRLFSAQGHESLIFSGRFSTPAKVLAWLESHPEFNASRVLVPDGRRRKK